MSRGDAVDFAQALGFESITPIPLSARFGDNVTSRSERLRWFDGPTLLEFLETLDADHGLAGRRFVRR